MQSGGPRDGRTDNRKHVHADFSGYSSFTTASPFDASLFVAFRKMLGIVNLNAINEKIVAMKTWLESSKQGEATSYKVQRTTGDIVSRNKGIVIFDGTTCPQDIAYPTDLDLLSDAREKSEQLIYFYFSAEHFLDVFFYSNQ